MKKLVHVNDLFFVSLQSIIDFNLDNVHLPATTIASALGISKSTLNRKLKELGEPPIKEFIRESRLQKSLAILSAGYTVRETSKRVGFKSPSYFTQCFKAYYHETPVGFAKRIS